MVCHRGGNGVISTVEVVCYRLATGLFKLELFIQVSFQVCVCVKFE